MTIGIVIPAINEAHNLKVLLELLVNAARHPATLIVVADGGSSDESRSVCESYRVNFVPCPVKRRSVQMNIGAAHLHTDIIYFLHADTIPPVSFAADILQAVKNGYNMGRYYSRFLSANPLLRINALVTRFNWFIGMGGDNSLFITSPLFKKLSGFDEALGIMEEYEFCERAIKAARYCIMPKAISISARKYSTNSWWKVLWANATAVRLYKRGASQHKIATTYKRMLNPY